jgi:hypothetical protein
MKIPFVFSISYRHQTLQHLIRRVVLLTHSAVILMTSSLITGCAFIKNRSLDHCKTHAYVEMNLEDYLSQRYQKGSPVRLGIIPFATSVNLAQRPFQYRGFGNEIASQVQTHFLNRGTVPISEILFREDWPAKGTEFFSGNFGAISQAREAGYDLILVGVIDRYDPYREIVASTKMIEVESGMTIWYGETTAYTLRRDAQRSLDYLNLEDRKPSQNMSRELQRTLSKCISNEIHSRERDSN